MEVLKMKKLLIVLFCVGLAMTFASQVMAKGGKNAGCTTIQSGELLASDGSKIETGYDQWGYNYQAHMFNGTYCDAYRDVAWCQPYKDDVLMMKWNDAWLSNKDCDDDSLLDRHYGSDSYIGSGAWLTNHMSGSYLGNWLIIGDWVLEFDFDGTKFIHEMIVEDNTFTGTGAYPAGGPYSITWKVIGTIEGDNIAMKISYDDSGYFVDAVGKIAQDGTMSGTWSNNSQAGTWQSTSGSATKEVCNWDYFVKIVAAPEDAYAEDGIWYSADGTVIGPVIWGDFATIQEVENDSCAGIEGAQYISPVGPGLGKW
jgi:hypothetical protein